MRCFPGVPSCEEYWIQASPVPAYGLNEDLFACVRSVAFLDFQVSSAKMPDCSCVVLYKSEDDIGDGCLELTGYKGMTNPEGLICETICEEKYTIGTLMGCEKQLTVDRENFRSHTMAKIAGQSTHIWNGFFSFIGFFPKSSKKN
ncbi:uncharacterized protein TNCV_2122081 [Trichonephila clavipes]|nr:uncharacterized protein TNCV_2122081 [Trichonephila clavipes]